MQPTRRLWGWLGLVFLLSFAALGWMGREIYLAAPPIPDAVVTASGEALFSAGQVELGDIITGDAGQRGAGSRRAQSGARLRQQEKGQ